MRTLSRWAVGLAWGSLLLLAAGTVRAGPVHTSDFAIAWGSSIDQMPTGDANDPVAAFLTSNTLAAISEMDVHALAGSMGRAEPLPLPDLVPVQASVRTYNAPAAPAPARAPMPAVPAAPRTRTVSLESPQATGLGDLGSGGRDVPLGDARYFNTAPGGYGTVLTGRPPGGLDNWSHVTRTAISYIRPNVNVQMMFALDVPGSAVAESFEGPGVESHALLAIERETRISSAEIGTTTTRFGRRLLPIPIDEPQTAVTAGLDLGLLPTFLSQMGMGVSIVASRGQETGNLRLALVGTTELPVDWTPEERPYQHPRGMGRDPLIVASARWLYPSGGIGAHPPRLEGPTPTPPPGPGPTPITPLTPITPNPPIPEPATLLILAGGAAALLARRRCR